MVRRKPSSGEHLIFTETGPYLLPDVIRCEQVERGRWTNEVVIRAETYKDLRLGIVLLAPAVASLLAAPLAEVPLEPATRIRPLPLPAPGKILEIPLLTRFVCFRPPAPGYRIAEFLTEKDQRVLVPFSSDAYKQFLVLIELFSAVH